MLRSNAYSHYASKFNPLMDHYASCLKGEVFLTVGQWNESGIIIFRHLGSEWRVLHNKFEVLAIFQAPQLSNIHYMQLLGGSILDTSIHVCLIMCQALARSFNTGLFYNADLLFSSQLRNKK